MLKQIISNARKYWPMHIGEGDGNTGFRIGGLPPIGLKPKLVSDLTQYFGTFPIFGDQDEELSIFVAFDYLNRDSPSFIANNLWKPLGEDVPVIQCAFHAHSKRSEDASLASEFNGCAVNIGPESMDSVENEPGESAHRIGGTPFFYPKYAHIAAQLLSSGYVHVLQWGYPGKGDCSVKGEWPFANYRFHLYLRQKKEGYEYKALLA